MKLGSNDIALALGNAAVDKAYLGTELVYSSAPPPPPPYDAQVEYLQSSGTQYIDTDFVPKDTPRIVVDVAFTGTDDKDVWGFANNTQPSWIGNIKMGTDGKLTFWYRYNDTTSKQLSVGDVFGTNTFILLDVGYEIIINNVLKKTYLQASFSSNAQSVLLFRARTNYHKVKIRSCKLYDGTTLKRSFIPVRVGTTGYMYDSVSGELFGNSGTGDFVLGSDV
jgi:hypothetical protein